MIKSCRILLLGAALAAHSAVLGGAAPPSGAAEGSGHHQPEGSHQSGSTASQSATPYAGMEQRAIKSLSAQDIADLRAGRGWGLALPAELNGVPGPAHLLELRDAIGLAPEQVAAIEKIHAQMQAEAQIAGANFIAAEAAIEAGFRKTGLAPEQLRALVDASAAARARLLDKPPVLANSVVPITDADWQLSPRTRPPAVARN